MITSRRILSISILFFFIGLLTCGFGQEAEKKVHIKVIISEEEENTGESSEKKEVHWIENSGDQKNEKKIIVKVLSDKEDVDATKPQNNVKIIVLDDEDGTIVAKDDVKVIKTKEENGSKTLKETKQKKKSKRKNK